MLAAPIPDSDSRRLKALHDLAILDTTADERFDRITRVAASLLGVPIVAVSLVDEDRQWFKSILGLEVKETGRDISFCGHAICSGDDLFVVPDAQRDPRFTDNPLVAGAPGIRFYAGGPVHTTAGDAVGTLCVIDTQPRSFTDEQQQLLRDLANMVQSEIRSQELGGMQREVKERRDAERDASEQEQRIRSLYTVAAQTATSTAEQLAQTLALGCKALGLDIGIVSQIEGDSYTVVATHCPAGGIEAGQVFDLGDTFCNETLKAAQPVAFEQASVSIDFSTHPCFTNFGLEAYIGAPIAVGGKPFGTLNFSSSTARSALFRKTDIDYVQLMGQWVSTVIERQQMVDEIEEARASAEQANRSKGDFLANMSHEIRTPMNAIIGLTELVLETELTDPQRENLESAASSAELLLTLLNDILDFSKIEAGKLDLERTPFDLAAILGGTVDTLQLRAQQKGLQLRCDVGADVPTALIGDPTRLRQIAINLVSNAIKFTIEGEVSVRVDTESVDDGRCTLRFCVRDTGTGISKDRQEAIFEAFTQEDGSITRQFGGTGLGLAISSRLVQLMGGRIWLESELGAGAAFFFSVPLGINLDNAAAFTETPAPARKAIAAQGQSRHALLAEDNPLNRRIALARLNQWGYTVDAVDNGHKAVEAAATGSYDVILMDVQMPEMDGLEATQAIRQAEQASGAHVPIIALTAHAMKGDRERFLQAGMDGYVSKPLRPDELLAAIEKALRQDS